LSRADELTVGAPGDYPGDGILCTLQTSDVFRCYADQNTDQSINQFITVP